jgi:hypothetical protein
MSNRISVQQDVSETVKPGKDPNREQERKPADKGEFAIASKPFFSDAVALDIHFRAAR